MAMVFNATEEEVSVQAQGNWFTFKPKQVKNMTDRIAQFLIEKRSEDGIVGLPAEFEDPDFKNTEEGRKILASKTKEGIDRFLMKQRRIVDNNLQSLARDLEMANIHTDSRSLASDGELKAMELLAKYQSKDQDEQKKRLEEFDRLQKKLGVK